MTLIYAAATPDIGFIVGDTLLVPLADIKGIPRGPVNGAHHALKIQILSSKTAVAFATENAVETSLRLIKGLYGELRADPTITYVNAFSKHTSVRLRMLARRHLIANFSCCSSPERERNLHT